MKKELVILILLLMAAAGSSVRGSEPQRADFYADSDVLAGYVLSSLERSPGLQSAWSRYRAALQKAPQVSALPDPMLSFTQFVRRVMEANNFMVSQTFPWFGKLDLAGQAAIKEAASMYQEYLGMERDLIAQVKLSYYELQYTDRAIRLTEEEQSLLDYYERLAQARYASGEGLQQEVIKIQAELSMLLDRTRMFKQQRDSLVARLNTLMDLPLGMEVTVLPPSDPPPVELDLEELYKLGEENRQELLAVLNKIESEERTIELRKKDYWPDFTLSAGMGYFPEFGETGMGSEGSSRTAVNVSVGINIPIWRNKYRAGVVEATESLIASQKGYRQIQNEVQFAIRDQVIRLEALKDQVEIYRSAILPQAEESLRSAEAAYQTGQVQALELLDSERMLIGSRLFEVRYQTDYWKALAELERAVGTRFPNE